MILEQLFAMVAIMSELVLVEVERRTKMKSEKAISESESEMILSL